MKRNTYGVWVTSATLMVSAISASAAPRARRVALPYVANTRVVAVPIVAQGVRLGTDALMLKDAGRTVLPMRALFASLGAQVVWNGRERAVYAWKTDGTGVRFGVGETEAQSLLMPGPNERATVTERRKLDAPPTLIGGHLYIPIRAAGELLGTEVLWDGAKRTVYLGTPPDVAVGATAVPDPKAK